MDYYQAVKNKIERQIAQQKETHPFKPSFWVQKTFENRRFLIFNYKKLVGQLAIPTGLCEICNLPKETHE